MMKEFRFSIPQNILFAPGSLNQLGTVLKEMGAGSAFLISGPHLKRMGVVDRAVKAAEDVGVKVSTFTETEGNPSTETVERAARQFQTCGADVIVALGGGSPMDVAKAAAILAVHGGAITNYEGSGKVPGEVVPMIAIPTTAGTGSEVTPFSVITDHSRDYKLSISSPYLLPDYAILDPELITSLPQSVAAATGIDAMVHAIEAYVSKAATPFSDAMAEKALKLLGGHIRAFASDRSDLEAAGAMLLGSTFAGIAFSFARLGNVHAMAHPVGGYFNVPHGVANAILLPVVLKFNLLADKGRYRTIYDNVARIPSDGYFEPEMLVHEIRKLTASLGIPASLSEVGVTEDKIGLMAEDAMKSGNVAVNPRETTRRDIEELYRKAM